MAMSPGSDIFIARLCLRRFAALNDAINDIEKIQKR